MMQHHNNTAIKQNGFTLVELAIALMVIGLLIGGVLKGQELIENARVTTTIRQIKAYDTAAMIFYSTYGGLPGDIRRPNRIPNCTGFCATAGDGDRLIGFYNRFHEQHNFFPHLTKAGMINGPDGGDSSFTPDQFPSRDERRLLYPVSVFEEDSFITIQGYHVDRGNEYLLNLSGDQKGRALVMDTKMDDGDLNEGAVWRSCLIDSGGPGYGDIPATPSSIRYCDIYIKAGF